MINHYIKFNYLLIVLFLIIILLIWDLYPLWIDYRWRYLLQKSFHTGTSLDNHYEKLDLIIHQSGDFEGHIGCSKDKISFLTKIIKKYNPLNIAEIGFNAGHSSCLFMNTNPNCSVTSFDLCNHKYSKKTQDYLKQNFPNRLKIICGDSTKTIPNFYTKKRFDLIFIDGGHENNIPYLDLKNSLKNLAKKGSLIIMDDTHYSFLVSKWLKLKYTFTVDDAWLKFIDKDIKEIDNIRGMSLGIVS